MKKFLNRMHSNIIQDVESMFNNRETEINLNTYISCVSEHSEKETGISHLKHLRSVY